MPNVAHKIVVHDLQWLWDELYRVDLETAALHPLLSSEEPALLQQALDPEAMSTCHTSPLATCHRHVSPPRVTAT